MGKRWKQWQTLFSWALRSLRMVTAATKLKVIVFPAPWKKSYDRPRQHIKKQRHHFTTKVHKVKAMVFPVVMYGCESWTIKKAEHWWIDVFELWCRRRLLRVPWTIGRSSPSILKEISPEYSLEGLMLKLKLQCFSHLMQRTDSFEKTLMLGNWMQKKKGKTEDEMVGWLHQLDRHEFEQALGVSDSPWGPWVHKELDMTEQLKWTDYTARST